MKEYLNPKKNLWTSLVKRPSFDTSTINDSIDDIFNIVKDSGDEGVRLLTKNMIILN
jgi:hypothetical protein